MFFMEIGRSESAALFSNLFSEINCYKYSWIYRKRIYEFHKIFSFHESYFSASYRAAFTCQYFYLILTFTTNNLMSVYTEGISEVFNAYVRTIFVLSLHDFTVFLCLGGVKLFYISDIFNCTFG